MHPILGGYCKPSDQFKVGDAKWPSGGWCQFEIAVATYAQVGLLHSMVQLTDMGNNVCQLIAQVVYCLRLSDRHRFKCVQYLSDIGATETNNAITADAGEIVRIYWTSRLLKGLGGVVLTQKEYCAGAVFVEASSDCIRMV